MSATGKTAKSRPWAALLEKWWLPLIGVPIDVGLIVAAFASAYFLRFRAPFFLSRFPVLPGQALSWDYYLTVMPVVAFLWFLVFVYAGELYDPYLPPEEEAVRALSSCLQGTVATIMLSFLFKRIADSRLVVLLMGPIAFFYVFLAHLALRRVWETVLTVLGAQPALLLVGSDKTSDFLRRRLANSAHRRVHHLPSCGKDRILAAVSQHQASEVILTQNPLDKAELIELIETLETDGVTVRLAPSLLELRMGEVQIDRSLGIPTILLRHLSLSGRDSFLKRIFDVFFSLLVLLVCAAPLAAVALLIRLDSPGPVFFRQKRIGYKGRTFDAFKFRTMTARAESAVADLKAEGSARGPYFKIKKDPRITRVGKWLRRLSLDEFPQFFNVVRGDMSVAGPRPLALTTGELEALEKHYGPLARKILNVRPGITGLWQVSGRSQTTDEERFTLDIYYIEHWTLGLDLKIILKTIPAMLSAHGAY